MKQETGEEKLKLESKPGDNRDDWMEILYDPQTDLTILDLDDNVTLERGQDSLMTRMYLLGRLEDEKNFFPEYSPLTVINENLNSPDSGMRKTGVLFLLCKEMLSNLRAREYQNSHSVLFHLLANGITYLLSRIMNARAYVSLPLPPPHQASTGLFLNIDTENNTMRFTHFNLENERFESLPAGTVLTRELHNEIFKKNTASISLEDIKSVIAQELYNIPYDFFPNFVNLFLSRLNRMHSDEMKTALTGDPLYNPEAHYKPAVSFFASLREAFLPCKDRILKNEQDYLFDDCKIFPEETNMTITKKIEEIIYHYTDSRALCFFDLTREAELVSDFYHPTP